MIVDEIITLEDGNEYVLLYKTQVDGGEYFVASKLVDANPSTEYQVFELAKEKLDTFVYDSIPFPLSKVNFLIFKYGNFKKF